MNRLSILFRVAALFTISSHIACGSEEVAGDAAFAGDSNGNELISPQVKPSWIGYELGVSPGTWRDMGPIQFSPDRLGEAMRPILERETPGVQEPEHPTVVMGDPIAGRMVEIDMDLNDMERVAASLERQGYAQGYPSDPKAIDISEEDDDRVYRAWSNGVDGRTPLGIHEYGASVWPYRTIGQMSSGCSATLVGTPETAYYIVTAAHCFWNSSGSYLDPWFYPRRDGCRRPNGTWISGCDTTPYGAWDGYNWVMPSYFVNNCVGNVPWTFSCIANDIAIQRVGRPAGEAFPGAMGFGYWSGNQLNGYAKYNRGYPACSGAGQPANCRSNTLFGDAQTCGLGSFWYPASGWNRIIEHSCDLNGGHSGSPLYLYSSGAKVFGVQSSEDSGCFSGCSDSTPNYMRRIDPWFYNVMLNFMGI
jgi:V8-like Glu-specific endopeptidase